MARPKRDLERQIERLERRWAEAVRDRDMAFLEELLGEEFTLTTGRGGAQVLMTDVFVRREGRWVAVTRHVSPLPASG